MTGMVGVAQAQERARGTGTALISNGLALSDRVTFTLRNVPPADAGMALEGWLVSDDGSSKLSTGILAVRNGSINHTFTSVDGENFIANYSRAVITVEPVPDSDPEPSTDVRQMDGIPLGAMTHVRHLVVSFPEGDPNGIVTNLQMQIGTALEHTMLARNSDNLDDLRTHTHHVINIIEGEGGDNFDDSFGNPGDGLGVFTHAQNAAAHGQLAINAAPGDNIVAENAELVIESSNNVETWATQARDQALTVLNEESLNIAKTLLNTVEGRLIAARDGVPATNMGGATQAYTQAQAIATFVFPGRTAVAASGPAGVLLPLVGDTAIPVVAQYALIASMVLLVSGVGLMIRDRRSRRKI